MSSATVLRAQSNGLVEGRVRAVADPPVQLDDSPHERGQDYARFDVIVRSASSGKEIGRAKPDGTGNYRLELLPGDYIISVAGSASSTPRVLPRKFTIAANKTTRVDLDVPPDLRKVAPDHLDSN